MATGRYQKSVSMSVFKFMYCTCLSIRSGLNFAMDNSEEYFQDMDLEMYTDTDTDTDIDMNMDNCNG